MTVEKITGVSLPYVATITPQTASVKPPALWMTSQTSFTPCF